MILIYTFLKGYF